MCTTYFPTLVQMLLQLCHFIVGLPKKRVHAGLKSSISHVTNKMVSWLRANLESSEANLTWVGSWMFLWCRSCILPLISAPFSMFGSYPNSSYWLIPFSILHWTLLLTAFRCYPPPSPVTTQFSIHFITRRHASCPMTLLEDHDQM